MIKYSICTGLLFSFFCQVLLAQEGTKLTIPGSPAFSILNFEPSAVMRPTNAKDLAADILNSFDKEGKLLLNLGLEVSPYWLVSHPGLKRVTYLNPNPGQAFMQSFSISAATVRDSATGGNKLGAGFRFKLFNGEPLKELEIVGDELLQKNTILGIIDATKQFIGDGVKTTQDAIKVIVDNLTTEKINEKIIANIKKDAEALKENYSNSPSDIKAFIDKISNNRRDGEQELIKKKSDLLYDRTGFILEFAGGTGFTTARENNLERIGFWGNASYYVSKENLFTLTARFMNQHYDTALNSFDIGLGFLRKTNSYNFSVEGMFRWFRAEIPDGNINNQPIQKVKKDFTYRIAMQGSYLISKEVSINISIGKDFESAFISRSGFFSILGFNYSIFSKEPSKLK